MMHAKVKLLSALKKVQQWASDDKGATAIEYGLIVALVVLTVIGALQLMATGTDGMFTQIKSAADTYL